MRVLKTEPNRTGFALIIALSLMAFIVLILVALSAITRMEVGSAESQGARVRAQENAQLGAILAIGRLQRDVGPDKRATARASIFEPQSDGSGGLSLQSPEWVGVWDTGTANWENLSQSERLSDAVWLVSGNTGKESSDGDYWTPEADLSAVASEDQVVLARNESVSPVQETVVLRENVGAGNEDYFAYWVSDENTKARVDLHDDFLDSSNNQELINSLNQVARSGVELVPGLEDYPTNDQRVKNLYDLTQLVDLARPSDETELALRDRAFFSLTPLSTGLQVDVKNGGLKKDLTQAFEFRKIFDRYFVPDPAANSDQDSLYFLDDPLIVADGIDGVDKGGPNWSILRSYYRQYIPGGRSRKYYWNRESLHPKTLELNSRIDMDDALEYSNYTADYFEPFRAQESATSSTTNSLHKYIGWQHYLPEYTQSPQTSTGLPYQTVPSDRGSFPGNEYLRNSPISDNYQLTSILTPIVSRVQLDLGVNEGAHGLEFWINPMFGLYNPYNVAIEMDERIKISWPSNPKVTIEVDGYGTVEFALREIMPNNGFGNVGFYLSNFTINPGETRYVGIDPTNSRYPADRIVVGDGGARGIALDTRADGTVDEVSDAYIYLHPYVTGHMGMVSTLRHETDDPRAYSAGVAVAHKGKQGTHHPNAIQKQREWGFTAGEAAILQPLTYPAIDESDPSSLVAFSIKFTQEDSPTASMNFAQYSGRTSNGVWSMGKMFPDLGSSGTPVESEVSFPSLRAASTSDTVLSIGYWLKSSSELDVPWRTLIDSNVRAINNNLEWDGFDEGVGYPLLSTYSAARPGKYGLFSPGDDTSPMFSDTTRKSGYWGYSNDPSGAERVVLFDRPRTPALSLGNLQHANMGRYNFDPTYMVGNSYPNIRIPLDATSSSDHKARIYNSDVNDFSVDHENFKMFDTSYLVNEKIWDSYFFSGITWEATEDMLEEFKSGGVPDVQLSSSEIAEGKTRSTAFQSRRYEYSEDVKELEFSVLDNRGDYGVTGGEEIYEQMAGYLSVNGAFNVNSSSKEAWMAFLGGLFLESIPIENSDATGAFEKGDGGFVVSRFSWLTGGAFDPGSGSGQENFWKGYRVISEDELENLAEAIVDQVKLRGPFLSLGDFVNRSLKGDDTSRAGALQAALDDPTKGLNRDSVIGSFSDPASGGFSESGFHNVVGDADFQAAGFPGFVMQGDLLQRLAPLISVRGDTFLIRSFGEYVDPITGNSLGEAWCETVVRRKVTPIDPDPANEFEPDDSSDFGRAFEVVGFRWMDRAEI